MGVERFGRVNWDTRLGPSDGDRDPTTGRGVTFAPTWLEDGRWVRLADVPERYRGSFSAQFGHPLLVRCAIDYAPINGVGPTFRHEFLLTPDGVLATLRSPHAKAFGVTWPVLENDGVPLRPKLGERTATTAYRADRDEQSFLWLDAGATAVVAEAEPIQSTYGWLRPVRAAAISGVNRTFVFPRSANDPSAEKLRQSFRLTQDGFDSIVGSVHGSLYTGRTSAGGEGTTIDCDGDGKPDATFGVRCRFVLQIREGRILAVEADRRTTAQIAGRELHLEPYVPLTL